MADVTSPPTNPPSRNPLGFVGKLFKNNTDPPRRRKNYFAALIMIANIVPIPILAGFITVAIYISSSAMTPKFLDSLLKWPGVGWVIVFTGLISTLIIWLLIAILFRNSTTFERVDAISASSLKRKREIVCARYQILEDQYPHSLLEYEHEEMVLHEIKAGLESLRCMIECEGPKWVLSTGYISAWGQLHDVEEAMMDILPCKTLLDEAMYDQLCLQGSNIPNADPTDANIPANSATVLGLLETAIQTLSASQTASPPEDSSTAALGLLKQALQRETLLDLSKKAVQALLHPADPSSDLFENETKARADLRKIRCSINQYNDERWAGLVRTRKLLMLTAEMAGVFTYTLLFISVLANVEAQTIIATAVFWIVGAITGIFNQLINEWTSKKDDQTVDDYGLTRARYLVTPILSGLAAIGGVFVAASLSLTLLGPSGQVPVASGLSSLSKIYSLSNLQGLIFAVIFGLVPSYLVGILKQQADNLKSQIKNSSPSN